MAQYSKTEAAGTQCSPKAESQATPACGKQCMGPCCLAGELVFILVLWVHGRLRQAARKRRRAYLLAFPCTQVMPPACTG